MLTVPKSNAFLRVALVATTGLMVVACGAGPTIPAAEAAPHIVAWLPGAEVRVVGSTAEAGGAVVHVDASGETLDFRFSHDESGWSPEGMLVDGRILDFADTKAAWVDIVRSPREVTLAQMIAGERPLAPMEVVVVGLRVVAVEEERMELESVSDPGIGHVVLNGRHFDNLPVAVGDAVALQVQTLRREGDDWMPERQTTPNELMVELEPLDITFLSLLKLRLSDKVVPIPYSIPDMDHDHGEGGGGDAMSGMDHDQNAGIGS